MNKLNRFAIVMSMAAIGTAAQAFDAVTAVTPAQRRVAPGSPTGISNQDRDFMMDAAQTGEAEVQASQLALQKATDPALKKFAQQMVDDHTRANAQLRQLALDKGVQLPVEPFPELRSRVEALRSASGKDFDREYAQAFGTQAHENAIRLFSTEARQGHDREVKKFAAEVLDTLQQHQQLAQGIQASAMGSR